MIAQQELWDLASARPALPPRYEAHYSTASGQGSGLRTAWLRSLRAPSQPADLVYDGQHWIASAVPLSLGGRALLFNAHLPPRLSYSEWVSEVKLMNHLRSRVRPDLCVLLGDLNSTGAPGTPLASALGALGPLSAWHRLVPPATPTNFTTRHGSPRSTAIDHIFATGPIASHTHHVLPCHTSHAMVLAQVTLHHRSCDAHSWRLFRWRLATVEDMDSLSTTLDLAWGWLSLTPSLPDHYIAAHHSLAHQLLPHPRDTPTLLRSLARFTFPLSTQDLAAQSFALREASAARGFVSRAAVLSSPSITSATRTVLRLPSPPLEPFHGILPHPGATLTTREERLAEITAQSRSQTANRHVSVDHAFFAARCTPDPWLPLLHPPTDLTLPLLRDALRANARPEPPASLRAYALTRQSPPLITTASLAHRRMGKRSLAVSPDNVARAALFRSGGGVHLGLLHLLLQLESGTPGVSNETVRYGLYKGKPAKPLPRHLTRSFRPVDVESGVSGAASGIATTRLAADLELTSTYTPASFAYRPGHSALGLPLVARAATYTALSTHGTCAICDWDESDAYLRVLRQDNSRLCSRLRATWDFGPWADGFYSRLVIRVATREGFAHPFSTEEGGNQGDGFAQLHYQAPSLVITRAMRPNTSITLPLTVPGHSASLPATHLSYSDDRRFITPSLTDVAAMASDCRECSRRAGRIIHPDKQEFSLIDSRPGRPTLVTADVPQHTGTTTTAPPDVVGIPILPELPLLRVTNKTRTSLDRARKASRNREACPILQLRSLHAFGLSPLDYVTSGVLIPPPSLRPHQVAINNAYRHAFRLPPWAHSAFLHLPLQHGGPGAPLLAYRAPLNLLRTYLRASWGPNTLAVAATASLVSPRRPTPWLTEGPALAQALAPLDITVHLLPSPRVRPAPQHHTGSLAPLRSLPYVVVACDGSQEGTRLGAGFLLWHPLHGTLYRGWLGLHALAGHSTDAEWIAKIAAMFTLRGWSGAALFASDSTTSQLCDLTRGPPPSSALSIPYRAALLSASFRMHEAWLPAQHDSGSAGLLATLNAEADSLARRGLRTASPWTLPWSALFHGRIVALHEGAIFLNPTGAAEAAYAATTARTHAQHLRPLPPGWSSHLLRLAYERAEIPALALHRIMHLRLLHSQDHPPGYGGVTCPFCHRPYPDSAAHLQHHRPPHYALQLLLAWHLFTRPPILAATAGHSPALSPLSSSARPPPQCTSPSASQPPRDPAPRRSWGSACLACGTPPPPTAPPLCWTAPAGKNSSASSSPPSARHTRRWRHSSAVPPPTSPPRPPPWQRERRAGIP